MLQNTAQPKLFFPTCCTTATSQSIILERNNGESGYSLLLHKPIYIDIIRQCSCRSKTQESMLNQNVCRFSLSYLSFWKNNFTACDGSLRDIQTSENNITSNHAFGFEIKCTQPSPEPDAFLFLPVGKH
jgi:hypothetical protein